MAKHKVQLECHEAVNRAIERFIYDDRRGSWRDLHIGGSSVLRCRVWLSNYDKNVPPTVPVPRQPLHKFLESAADWFPKRTASIFYGAKLTYQQLDWQANQFAHALHGFGVKPDDRVMLVMPNTPQRIVAYFGALKIGGVVVLPNPDAGAVQVVQQIQQTRPRVLVTLKDFAPGRGRGGSRPVNASSGTLIYLDFDP